MLVLILIFTLPAGGWVLACLLAAASVIGMSELMEIYGAKRKSIAIAAYLGAVLIFGACLAGWERGRTLALVAGAAAVLAVYVFTFPTFKAGQAMAAVFSLFYLPFLLSYVYLTRALPGGAYLVWLIFLASWGCDTCAYCVGMLIGKHKMTPKLSPKKSVEGAVGGVIGAGILGAVFGAVFADKLGLAHPALMTAAVCMIGSLLSMVGDLTASGIKRDHNVKDYGTLIPGHGGILDRFDSVIPVAPAVFYALVIFQGGWGALL